MPVEGFKTITVSQEVYDKIENFAEKTHRSVPKAVEFLMEKADVARRRQEKQNAQESRTNG